MDVGSLDFLHGVVDDLNILTDLIRIGSDFRHTLTGLRDLGQCELDQLQGFFHRSGHPLRSLFKMLESLPNLIGRGLGFLA